MAFPQKFDVVLSERCLINLPNWEEQREGLRRMREHLNVDGHLILVENFKGGLAQLNRLRASLDLPPISERWHNNYLPDDEFEEFIADRRNGFNIRRRENIGNLYYILSRVLYAKLAADAGVEPAYDHPINEIAAKLPSLGKYAYSPNYLMVLGVR
jgi:SAM-dependent methyltransferase